MKKSIVILYFAAVSLLLSSCGGASQTPYSSGTSSQTSSDLSMLVGETQSFRDYYSAKYKTVSGNTMYYKDIVTLADAYPGGEFTKFSNIGSSGYMAEPKYIDASGNVYLQLTQPCSLSGVEQGQIGYFDRAKGVFVPLITQQGSGNIRLLTVADNRYLIWGKCEEGGSFLVQLSSFDLTTGSNKVIYESNHVNGLVSSFSTDYYGIEYKDGKLYFPEYLAPQGLNEGLHTTDLFRLLCYDLSSGKTQVVLDDSLYAIRYKGEICPVESALTEEIKGSVSVKDLKGNTLFSWGELFGPMVRGGSGDSLVFSEYLDRGQTIKILKHYGFDTTEEESQLSTYGKTDTGAFGIKIIRGGSCDPILLDKAMFSVLDVQSNDRFVWWLGGAARGTEIFYDCKLDKIIRYEGFSRQDYRITASDGYIAMTTYSDDGVSDLYLLKLPE